MRGCGGLAGGRGRVLLLFAGLPLRVMLWECFFFPLPICFIPSWGQKNLLAGLSPRASSELCGGHPEKANRVDFGGEATVGSLGGGMTASQLSGCWCLSCLL